MNASRWSYCFVAAVIVLLGSSRMARAQGLQLSGIGPVNRSMGGAATAAPIEAIGATAFNPATLTALPNQLSVGAELVNPHVRLSSQIGALNGATDSDSGWAAVPSIGLAWKPDPEGPLTYGFGVFGLAGYSVNYDASTTNPIRPIAACSQTRAGRRARNSRNCLGVKSGSHGSGAYWAHFFSKSHTSAKPISSCIPLYCGTATPLDVPLSFRNSQAWRMASPPSWMDRLPDVEPSLGLKSVDIGSTSMLS